MTLIALGSSLRLPLAPTKRADFVRADPLRGLGVQGPWPQSCPAHLAGSYHLRRLNGSRSGLRQRFDLGHGSLPGLRPGDAGDRERR